MKEVNFDGLVGPSHNYSGLAIGNLASTSNSGSPSRPREAALQGLEKMLTLSRRGVPQAFLPPQLRPSLPTLRRLGFRGNDAEVLKTAFATDPGMFAACSSASAMWTANAATVTPSADTLDQKVHFTPANLVTNFHRSIEVEGTARILKSIFHNSECFAHHLPLPATPAFADEGAANHTRLGNLHLFAYGSSASHFESQPERFPSRQTLEASQTIARLHQIPAGQTVFVRQNPEAIDAGVFHNDVISVGHENLFLYHEAAFFDCRNSIDQIKNRSDNGLYLICVPESEISVPLAVKTYLFNSQIVTLPNGEMLMLCPAECGQNRSVQRFIDQKIINSNNPVSEVIYCDLKQSMRNGGGPACLRLRVPLTDTEIETLPPRIFLTRETEKFLKDWINQYYPEELELAQLVDINRFRETSKAIEELHRWTGLTDRPNGNSTKTLS